MLRKRASILTVLCVGLIARAPMAAERSFFEGKTIRIVVGASAGGGLDTYSRVIARHLAKHIQGKPTVIIENMPGAGSLIAANHVYKAAKPDGLTLGNFIGGVLFGQILGRPGIEFDAPKYEYIGVPSKFTLVCAFTRRSGITGVETWIASRKPVKLGGAGPGTGTEDVPRILKGVLGFPIHLVSGYKSIGDIRLAAEAGEVDGVCGAGWQPFKAVWRKALETGDVTVVLQAAPQPDPQLPNVPLAISYAKTEEARQLLKAGIHDPSSILFVYVLPPETPKERVGILRTAFEETFKDPEFMVEAKKANLEINPLPGEELEKLISGLFKLDPALVAKLREILR